MDQEPDCLLPLSYTQDVGERCTCGALLPEDARFCHKCGKPQLEEDRERLESLERSAGPVQGPIEPPAVKAAGAETDAVISFRNSRAVVTTLLVAAGAMLGLPLIPMIAPALLPIFLCGIGFVAVRIYRARSVEALTASSGAKLGGMTGLWLFLVIAVVITLFAVVVASPEGWNQMRAMQPKMPQVSELLQRSQHEVITSILLALPSSFLMFVLLPGLGGLLSAMMLRRRPQS